MPLCNLETWHVFHMQLNNMKLKSYKGKSRQEATEKKKSKTKITSEYLQVPCLLKFGKDEAMKASCETDNLHVVLHASL